MLAGWTRIGQAPVFSGALARNTMLDWFFYDVGGLTPEERAQLVSEPNEEGSILVVWPRQARGAVGIRRFSGYESLRAAPGDPVRRFTIAEVGSSGIGAAAFARTVADHHDEPVGAIVAGYGVADLLTEAMGGWFVMGGANRVMQMYQDALDRPGAEPAPVPASGRKTRSTVEHRHNSSALFNLLLDPDRQVRSVAGHSKGCLSIAFALEALVRCGRKDAVARQSEMRVTTVGTVTALPGAFCNLGQYLGELDWFGGMNSQLTLDYTTVPGAWHHLNTALPGHLDFAAVLDQEPS